MADLEDREIKLTRDDVLGLMRGVGIDAFPPTGWDTIRLTPEGKVDTDDEDFMRFVEGQTHMLNDAMDIIKRIHGWTHGKYRGGAQAQTTLGEISEELTDFLYRYGIIDDDEAYPLTD